MSDVVKMNDYLARVGQSASSLHLARIREGNRKKRELAERVSLPEEVSAAEIKSRDRKTKEERRILAEEAVRYAFEESEKRRCLTAMKTARLRALRLAARTK